MNTLGQEYVIYTCSYMAFQGFLVWTHGQKLMGGEGRLTLKKVVKNRSKLLPKADKRTITENVLEHGFDKIKMDDL